MTEPRRRLPGPQLRMVSDTGGDSDAPTDADAPTEAEADQERSAGDQRAPTDAMEALLLAKRGYQAAGDAADGARLPSLTDFVD